MAVHRFVQSDLHARVRASQISQAGLIAESLKSGLTQGVEALRAIGALFAASLEVEPDEFQAFVEILLRDQPATAGFAWIAAADGQGDATPGVVASARRSRAELIETLDRLDLGDAQARASATGDVAASSLQATAPTMAPWIGLVLDPRAFLRQRGGGDGQPLGTIVALIDTHELVGPLAEALRSAGLAGVWLGDAAARFEFRAAAVAGESLAGLAPVLDATVVAGGQVLEMAFLPDHTAQAAWLPWAMAASGAVGTGLCGAFLLGVSARRRVLADSERRLRAVVQALPFPVAITRPGDGTILDANDAAARLFGVPLDRLIGSAADLHYARAEDRAAALNRIRRDGRAAALEIEVKAADGSPRWLFGNIEPIELAQRRALLSAFVDITELKKAHDAQVAARDAAEAANRAKSDFLAMMSHELRTPLNAIIGFSEMIDGALLGPIGNPKYLDYARGILDSGRHLLSLINDILDLSKIEACKAELQEDIFDVALALRSVMAIIKERASHAQLEVEFQAAEPLPPLFADSRRIKQVLINLLANAVKFTPAGGKVALSVWARNDSGYVFQVADTGVGIALEDIPKALAPFGQVNNGLDRAHEGTGLGLPLAKALAELHGGSLDLQSTQGKGTTVTVRLPARRIMPVDRLASAG